MNGPVDSLEKANGLVRSRHTVGPRGAGAAARPGPRCLLATHRSQGWAPGWLAFEAEGSSLLPQLITRDNGTQPCPLPTPSSGRG